MHVDTDPDVRLLRGVLRDLVALSAIPATWIESEPPAVAAGLADTLVGLLQLDFAYVRLSDPGGDGPVEVARGSAWTSFPEWLEGHLAAGAPFRRKEVVPDVGDDSARRRGFAVPVGVNGEGGVVAAASERSDFPTPMDQLLLSIAANHAAAAFQSARLILARKRAEEELRRARDELEVNVADRTAELHQANEDLSALRRVATLVAQRVQPDDLFAVVAAEIARVVDVPLVRVVRYEPDGTATECATFSMQGSVIPFGKRWSLEGTSVLQLVRDSSEATRIDDYSELEGEVAEIARRSGIRSAVGVPMVVAGRLWGAVVASSKEELPEGMEARLADFTELLATAIANAESREALARLAGEQAALRRVATLVAHGVPPEELFAAVTEEVGQLLPVSSAAMGRYGPDDGMFTTVAAWSMGGAAFPVGKRWIPEGKNVMTMVFETGRPARIDNFADASGPVGVAAREAGYRSAVGTPIIVEDRLWGVMTAASSAEQPLPSDTEARLASFTELVGTAISNAESRESLARLADEQTTLRRMATLVARGVPPGEIFSVVSEEVGRLVGSDTAAVVRFEHDPPSIVVVGVGLSVPGIPIGTRWELDDGLASTEVYRSGRSARIDARDWASVSGPIHEPARRAGLASTVASPISVEGRLWGTISVSAKEPLPVGTEARLERFSELLATAIANAEGKSELAASRRRIVAASDETRRRIERDLHDGTQQRLVSLGLAIRAAEANIPPDEGNVRAELSRIAIELADAVEDLQEISRGIHPAILSQGGLGPALRTLARRSTIPVELDAAADMRLPESIEVAAYFVASEALANATKHAQASSIEVSLTTRNRSLVLSIRDDGVGGADPARGSGLVGLSDRVESLGGSIHVRSRAGDGTQITAELPLELGPVVRTDSSS